jgi:hypothetical protein
MAILSAIASHRPLRAVVRGCGVCFLALVLPNFPLARAAPPPTPPTEYQIKAVFLFNFAQFVEWPESAFHDAQAPLVIGVLGEDPFGAQLDEAVRGEKIGQRLLLVRRYRRVDEIAECHILFISGSEAVRFDTDIAKLKGRSLLTVSDTDTFNRRGGMVRFFTENNKIRLRINVAAAKAAGLVISSKLLRPAMIFNPEKD